MLETPHVALGAAIAVAIPNPIISIPLAFTSHFLLDMTPHWNPHLNTETKKYGKLTNSTLLIIGFDLACTALLVGTVAYYFRSDNSMMLNIIMASFAAILPDVVEGPYFLWGYKNKFVDVWMKFQKSIQVDANIFWGLITQVVVLGASLYLIFS